LCDAMWVLNDKTHGGDISCLGMVPTYVWNICKIQIKTLVTYIWNRWNTLNKHLQHISETLTAYATSWSTFATFIWNTWNIPLKHLKPTFTICTFSATSPCCLGNGGSSTRGVHWCRSR
jgi:hypothetical protein